VSTLGIRLARVAARSGAGIRYVLGKRHLFGIADLNNDDYWRIRGDHQVVARFPIIAKHLNRGETLLDIGCGEGTRIAYLTARTGVVGVGFDISSVALEMTRSKGAHARVADVMAPDFAPDHTYDTVLISEVLEHIADPERVVTRVRDHVGQLLILTFPNIAYLPHRLRLLFESFLVQWGWHPGEHLRFWSLADFTGWLDQFGYEVESAQASNGIRGLAAVRPSLFGNLIVVARPRR